MRPLTSSLLAVLYLASIPVLADISVFGVPAIIQPGQPFSASFQNAIQQPAQYTMVWGYTPYDDTTTPGYMPQHNTVGMPIATVYFPDYLATAQNGKGNVTGLTINGNVGHKVGVHAMIWGEFGVLNSVTIHSWLWNVTLGDATSYDNYIMAQKVTGPNFKSFNL
ncbi:hypothetical protein QBC33DRAFT_542495 [Phialemonium atrogriseum]|uniref:Uncharacterized protein n=1 Tax=Phialemonium atrogriseum TaxID=1093897 RepID=A0AAJ0BXV7_9PEZI|nr:uncharacterized protein QBC33DRAFT_542495 [Phialemonium atrogriseum]KAK1766315.1 hypothetical protein QBC33DRAFT_542495 [Phialemonium atrogriseum]